MILSVALKGERPKVRSVLVWKNVCSYCGHISQWTPKVRNEVRKISMDRMGNC